MNSLNPKEILIEDTSNLIWIINSRPKFWTDDTKDLAKDEIKRRRVPLSVQNKILEDYLGWDIETETEWEQIYLHSKSERNELDKVEKDGFSVIDKVLIIISAPFNIFNHGRGPDLYSLFKDGKMKMFWEKLILLIFGVSTWMGLMYYIYQESENKRMEEIEKIDISDWEKEHGYD